MDFRNDIQENGRWVRYPDGFAVTTLIESALQENGKSIEDIAWVGSSDGKCKKDYNQFVRDHAEEVKKLKSNGYIKEESTYSKIKQREIHYFEFHKKKEVRLPSDFVVVGKGNWWLSGREDSMYGISFEYHGVPSCKEGSSNDWCLLQEPYTRLSQVEN